MHPSRLSTIVAALCFSNAALAETISADVVVFGGTAGGVSAACTAARQGKTAVVVEPGLHIGGLTSGGLGYTDIGNKAAIGGFSRAFYQRLGKAYGRAEAWTFAPGVAERELRALLEEHKVRAVFSQRLKSVKKNGAQIAEFTTEDGNVYRGKMFVDATYEGDLMAKAGVKYMVGREDNARFAETLNGIRAETPKHQFLVDVDPYVTPGDAKSGVLPLVSPEPPGTPGAGDRAVQAYNFRLCFTNKPENRLPIEPPPNYDAKQFELLGRYCEALVKAGRKVGRDTFFKWDMVTPDKTDVNNNGAISTDFIGMNYDYPEASYAERERIAKATENYIRGLIHFLKTDPRVPANVGAALADWGLCKDEFPNTGGWPHNLYVREARRMESDYVMSEKVCRGVEKPDDVVGLGAYNMDSHNCRRIVVNGVARNEGDVQVGVKPYPISYRSIVPRAAECSNLFVPVALAATHIAYGSIRMEPVFMILGESSALAACLAIDGKTTAQAVPYAALKAQLVKAGQVLEWHPALPGQSGGNPGGAESAVAAAPKLPGIVLDDTQGTRTGEWEHGSLNPRVGTGYLHDADGNKGKFDITWTPEIPTAGDYEVFLHYVPSNNRATNVPVQLRIGDAAQKLTVNQRKDGPFSLGIHRLPAGKQTSVRLHNSDTDGHVIADGVQFLPVKK